MLKILIVEDEPLVAADIEGIIEELGHKSVGIAEDANAAMALMLSQKPELLLLDVKLGTGKDGIDIAHVAQDHNLPFIFITDLKNEETLVRIKQTKPFAYLTKPVDTFNIKSAIDIASYKMSSEATGQTQVVQERVLLRKGSTDERHKVEVDDIIWVKSDGNACEVMAFDKGEKTRYHPDISMGNFIAELNNQNLIRVSRTYAVNLKHVDNATSARLFVKGFDIPIGQAYKSDFFERIRRY